MPARQFNPRSGRELVDAKRGDASSLHEREPNMEANVELKPKVAPRGNKPSSSFAAPLRDSFRESFFDLAQRYQSLREAARNATRSRKSSSGIAPIGRTLADLPASPPPAPEPRRHIPEEEEPTLVQPLATRASDAPPASERRPTVRPPPPPDPLPRLMLPSSLPPPMAVSASAPPPAAPPSVWRPMLAAAALSATIGAIVSGGFLLLRSPAPAGRSVAGSSITTTVTRETTAPCPINVNGSGATAAKAGTSTLATLGTTTATGGSSDANSTSSRNGAPLQVSVENLPLETASSRSSELSASRLTASRFTTRAVTPVTRAAAVPVPERKRSKHETASHEAASASDDSGADKEASLEAAVAAPEPPPTPTKGPDRAAIAKAVGRAAAAAKACDSGPRNGRAAITFAPSGNVASVQLVESFGDNAVNGCVLRALGRAHVPPFVGGPVEVRKGISW
jgi:hypothetical protein